MLKTFRFRIYPTKREKMTLERMLEECRWVYNQTLALRRDAWKERKERTSYYSTTKLLPKWKKERPSLNIVYSQVLQDVQRRVDKAFKGFFRRVKNGEKPGYPRFKGRGRYRSLTYPQFGFGITDDGKLHLAKVGDIKIKLHRPLEGKIKQLTIRRYPTGKWFACFTAEVEPEPLPKTGKYVGIDLGLTTFARLSNGEQIANPRFFRKEEKALAKAQRRLSKCKEGSPEYSRRRRVVARVHERIANKRTDFSHKLSRCLVNEYDIICFEDLAVKSMVKNRCLAKSISDAAWRQLIVHTMQKAESAARRVVLVDPKNTTKICSRCGCFVEKSLSERVHRCLHCGLKIDRDLNAAINILRVGLHSLGSSPRSSLL
jgi:putative transposase